MSQSSAQYKPGKPLPVSAEPITDASETDRNASSMAALLSQPWIKIGLDVLAFASTLIMAWAWQWRAADLVWSLWLTSLVLGSSAFAWWLLTTSWRWLPRRKTPATLLRWVLSDVLPISVSLGLIYVIFFVGVHFVYSIFLGHLLPVAPNIAMPSVAGYKAIWQQYRLFLPVALAREFPVFIATARDRGQADSTTQGRFWISLGKNLIRTHILVFVLAFAVPFTGGAQSFLLYAVVSAVYFFPWNIFKKNGPESDQPNKILDVIAEAQKRTREQLATESAQKAARMRKSKR